MFLLSDFNFDIRHDEYILVLGTSCHFWHNFIACFILLSNMAAGLILHCKETRGLKGHILVQMGNYFPIQNVHF